MRTLENTNIKITQLVIYSKKDECASIKVEAAVLVDSFKVESDQGIVDDLSQRGSLLPVELA